MKQTAAEAQKLAAPVIDKNAFDADSTISYGNTPSAHAALLKKNIDAAGSEVWNSLSRKITKPIQRIDFSQLKVDEAVKEDITKTASAWASA